MRHSWSLSACILSAACASASATQLQTGAAQLSSAWRPVHLKGTVVAFHHVDGGALSASLSCGKTDEEAPLDVLTNHLLFELESRKEYERRPVLIDGRSALRTRMRATMDGVPVELDLVVFKKDGCVVDAQLVTAEGRLETRAGDFTRFYEGLQLARSRP
jgi:hypothetical protein